MKKTVILTTLLIAWAQTLSSSEPTGYYSSCTGKNGADLLSALFKAVGPHTNVGYDGLWEVYETSDIDADGKVWDMYSTKRWAVNQQQCGNYKNVGDCYNREHSFPKSWFGGKVAPMYSDAFHLYPTDGKVNGQRSSNPYGECANGTTLPSSNGIHALGRLGTSTFDGYSGTVFEPDDQYKGDFARSYFYMAAAYNDKIKNWNSPMLAGNSYPAFSSWAIDLLLKWHRQDPVSKKETDRNEAVYAYQKNRNPFIDHPELAEYIWGDRKSETWTGIQSTEPAISLPVSGSTLDMGITKVGSSITRSLTVKGMNLTGSLSVTSSSPAFSVTPSTISSSAANSDAGANINITYNPGAPGQALTTITISSASLSTTVSIKASAVTGIPALEAQSITDHSFVARWLHLDDDTYYYLYVYQAETLMPGCPIRVYAAQEEYLIDNLLPATPYSYRLEGNEGSSTSVCLTTASLLPSIAYINGSEVSFTSAPATPSDYIALTLDIENIISDLSISVDPPFEISTDLSDWSQSILLDPREDHFYIRLGEAPSGAYETIITISADGILNDEGEASAIVSEPSIPWFVEDFERAGEAKYDQYTNTSFDHGKVANWILDNAGCWSSDSNKNGKYSLRLGNNSTSKIETAEPKTGGIGTVTFYAAKWGSDADMVIAVQYQPQNSSSAMARAEAEWITAGEVTVSSNSLQPYSVVVNRPGLNKFRLQQIAGKRANIDDIVVTDFIQTSAIDTIDSEKPSWEAYNLQGDLTIDNRGPKTVIMVYNLEGRTLFNHTVALGHTSLRLPAGIYFVSDGTTARRVLVK